MLNPTSSYIFSNSGGGAVASGREGRTRRAVEGAGGGRLQQAARSWWQAQALARRGRDQAEACGGRMQRAAEGSRRRAQAVAHATGAGGGRPAQEREVG